MTPERALGRRGEDYAHRFLEKRGFRIVARNYRAPAGGNEIDFGRLGQGASGVCRSENPIGG